MAAIVHTPHDLLAKMSLKDIAIAKDFLKAHLPAHIQKRIDFDTLILTDGEFVSPKFTKIQSDVVYSCKIDGIEGYIYVLIEHQSAPHPLMAFRKLQYEVALMDAHLKAGHNKLPVTIPLCLYHGDQSPYPYSNDVYDCFNNPELAKEVSLAASQGEAKPRASRPR
jgi:predicted transposase/invertase (TIGR01784 family)